MHILIRYKGFSFPLLLLFVLSCNRGEEIPAPELKQQTYSIGRLASVIEFDNIRLDIPDDAVDNSVVISFEYINMCEMYRNAFFINCMVPTINPVNTEFNKPVRLTIRENMHWFVDERGLDLGDYLDSIAIFELFEKYNFISEIEDCEIRFEGDDVIVSGDIWHLGSFQIGIRDEYYYKERGYVNYWMYFDYDTVEISVRTGSADQAQAYYQPSYLDENSYLVLQMQPDDPGDWPGLLFRAQIDTTGTYTKIARGFDEYFFATIPGTHDIYTIRSLDGEIMNIDITRFDRGKGYVNGTFKGPGRITNEDWSLIDEMVLEVAFSLPIRY